MTRFLRQPNLPSPYVIAPDYSGLRLGSNVAWALATYAGGNRALYIPFSLPVTARMASMSCWIGTSSGTFDLGLIDGLGTTRLASMGSTSTASGKNTWTPTDPILLEAGVRYYAAISCSNTTATFTRLGTTALVQRAFGMAQQATAHPIPANPVPAQVGAAFYPLIALTFVT